MKKLFILIAVMAIAGMASAQFKAPKLGLELTNAKIIACHIATTGTADIKIPLFIAPCAGYIITNPRMSSTSGTAAADTAYATHWEFFIVAYDSVATAVTDTIAHYLTFDTSAYYFSNTTTRATQKQTALKNYSFDWLSASSSRKLTKRDVVALDCQSVGTTPVAVTNVVIEFVFIPTYQYEYMPR